MDNGKRKRIAETENGTRKPKKEKKKDATSSNLSRISFMFFEFLSKSLFATSAAIPFHS
jgi:hypothetical protein